MTPQKKCEGCNTPVEATAAKESYENYNMRILCIKCRQKVDEGKPLPTDEQEPAAESAPSAPHEEPDQQTFNSGDGSVDDVPVFHHSDKEDVETIIPAHVEVLPALTNADIVRPAISAQAAIAAWQEFQSLKTAILDKTDIMVIQGNNYTKKAGWRKFATFYNLTDKITEEKRITTENGEFIWKIKVDCTAPNGRTTEGVAMCSSGEKSGKRIEHDTYSTAHTRAKNRAISDMIAAGEVSAEEMA